MQELKLKLLEERKHRGKISLTLVLAMIFRYSNKSKNQQVGLHPAKNLLPSKRNNQQNERQLAEKIFSNHLSDMSLISKIYKEFIQLDCKKTQIIQLKIGQST